MGGKGICAKIRRLNKGKKPHEPIYDPDELPAGSIIAVDVSTMLVQSARKLQAARRATVFTKKMITQVRRAEKGTAKVTCDVVANLVRWTQRRPGITAVSFSAL